MRQYYVALIISFVAFYFLGRQVSYAQLPQVAPESVGLDGNHLESIAPLIRTEIEAGNLPGCVVMIGRRGSIAFAKAYGHRQLEPSEEEMTVDTVFDMASITKPVATATSIMLLVERGKIRLRDPVARYIPEFSQNGKEKVTIEHLLTHHGGLIPDNALKDYQQGPAEAWRRIWALNSKYGVGQKFVYTDVGFLVLGEVVRRITGKHVAEFAVENVYRPLGMKHTSYLPPDSLHPRIAPTEKREGKWLRGEVHDPRAALLEGVAGHAGLFSSAHDLALYANMMLSQGTVDGVRILGANTIQEMTRARDVSGQRRGLGWDMRSKYSSNRSELFSRSAFGHGGFTGTAMWIDPELDLFVIFLSSRLHPDGVGSVNHLAGRIGTVAAASIMNSSKRTTEEKAVLLGIDVLQRDQFRQLEGRKVGIITNHTGLNSDEVRTIDLLQKAPQVELVSIFSPEHGLKGKLDVSEIADAFDSETKLPVYSLYGKTRKPLPEQLQGIDTFVFDIQDIGARFYTYISTMGLAMEAAAENGLHFVVLDRPNPIGGTLVEGPILDSGDESFVGYHTLPIRHGMTIGELALMFQTERNLNLELEIVPCQHWRRGDYWDRSGVLWTNPSPNMRNLTQAVLYPGIGILETTNLSVGRGTDTPFELFGAPWIEPRELAAKLNDLNTPGVRFVPIRFTPQASKFANEECGGVNLIVTNRSELRPVSLGFQVACTLRALYPQQWDTSRLNRLLINQEVYQALLSESSADSLAPLYQSDLDVFLQRRAKYLLYRE